MIEGHPDGNPWSPAHRTEAEARRDLEYLVRKAKLFASPGVMFAGEEARRYAHACEEYRRTGDKSVFSPFWTVKEDDDGWVGAGPQGGEETRRLWPPRRRTSRDTGMG